MKRLIINILTMILPLCLFAQGLKIHSGANLKGGNSTNDIVIGSGNWTNNGTFTHQDATVHFTGSANQKIDGSVSSDFYNLNLNKSGGDLMLGANISVEHELQMNSGDLDLQNSVADLDTTGKIINESNTNRIKVGDPSTNTGTIQATRTINSVTDCNPGNLGVLITTPNDLGSTTVVRGHQVQQGTGSYIANESVARYVQVPGIGKLESGVNVEMYYWHAELNGHNEPELIEYQKVVESPNPGAWWTPLDGSVDTGSNLVTPVDYPYSDHFDHGSYNFTETFTLGSEKEPLPVELIAFDGTCHEDFVDLSWTTASEINNEIFLVQRSVDGNVFETIGNVQGAGNSNQLEKYDFADEKPVPNAYYRLKQVDFNGDYKYSNIINVKCINASEPQFAVYPNPFREELNVIVSNLPDSRFTIKIYSMDSRLVKNYQFEALTEETHKILFLDDLAPAMYVIRIISDDFVKTYKIDKQ
ncbi:MAG: T9SS type A sorting domain-containing protein [Bacteroidota bacterium]|nr:T9SS type A sorting domain-containing protein [Bacteroidota bacterium]